MKLYIVGPRDGGEGVYSLVAENGECLASHFCSSYGYAEGDLERNRPERQKEWKGRFGSYEVVVIGRDEMTIEELIKRNQEWGEKLKEENKKDES